MVVDQDLKPVPIGTEGELCIAGRNIMKGYHNKPEATAETLFSYEGLTFFRTGDMGKMDEEGRS